MENVLLKYVGGRSFNKVMWQRKTYIFKKDTDYVCECPQDLVEWLARNASGQFQVCTTRTEIKEVIKEVERKPVLKCDKCEFVAKSEQGLITHKHFQHPKEKKGGKNG